MCHFLFSIQSHVTMRSIYFKIKRLYKKIDFLRKSLAKTGVHLEKSIFLNFIAFLVVLWISRDFMHLICQFCFSHLNIIHSNPDEFWMQLFPFLRASVSRCLSTAFEIIFNLRIVCYPPNCSFLRFGLSFFIFNFWIECSQKIVNVRSFYIFLIIVFDLPLISRFHNSKTNEIWIPKHCF